MTGLVRDVVGGGHRRERPARGGAPRPWSSVPTASTRASGRWAGLAMPAAHRRSLRTGGPLARRRTRVAADIRVTFCDGHEWYEAPVGPDDAAALRPDAPLQRHRITRAHLCGGRGGRHPRDPRRRACRWTARRGTVPAACASGVRRASSSSSATPRGTTIRRRARDSRSGCSSPSGLALRVDGVLAGRLSSIAGGPALPRRDHARLVRDRHRLTRMALLMASDAVAQPAGDRSRSRRSASARQTARHQLRVSDVRRTVRERLALACRDLTAAPSGRGMKRGTPRNASR